MMAIPSGERTQIQRSEAGAVCDRCSSPAPIGRDAYVKVVRIRKITQVHICASCADLVEGILGAEEK